MLLLKKEKKREHCTQFILRKTRVDEGQKNVNAMIRGYYIWGTTAIRTVKGRPIMTAVLAGSARAASQARAAVGEYWS